LAPAPLQHVFHLIRILICWQEVDWERRKGRASREIISKAYRGGELCTGLCHRSYTEIKH
jgi:hypothetical protein